MIFFLWNKSSIEIGALSKVSIIIKNNAVQVGGGCIHDILNFVTFCKARKYQTFRYLQIHNIMSRLIIDLKQNSKELVLLMINKRKNKAKAFSRHWPNMLVLSSGSPRMEIARSHIHYVEKGIPNFFKVAKITRNN